MSRSSRESAAGPTSERKTGQSTAEGVRNLLVGGGRPLDDSTRAEMEHGLGHELGDVRVHRGPEATASALALDAAAYTVGSHVVVTGDFELHSTAGRRLLAHELVHVVQQGAGPVSGSPIGDGLTVSDPSDGFEREADRIASLLAGGRGYRSTDTEVDVAHNPSGSRLGGVAPATATKTTNPFAVQRIRYRDDERKRIAPEPTRVAGADPDPIDPGATEPAASEPQADARLSSKREKELLEVVPSVVGAKYMGTDEAQKKFSLLLPGVDIAEAQAEHPGYTTCGALPSYVLHKLELVPNEAALKALPDDQRKGWRGLSSGGLGGVRDGAVALGAWVQNDGTQRPEPGDIYLLEGPVQKRASDGSMQTFIGLRHIGILVSRVKNEDPKGTETWETADAGQGMGVYQEALKQSRTYDTNDRTVTGKADKGTVVGWVSIDRIPSPQRHIGGDGPSAIV